MSTLPTTSARMLLLLVLVPLALMLGVIVSTPDVQGMLLVGALCLVLVAPLLLRWHHIALIMTWNASLNVFFLPGQPELWMLGTVASLGISLLSVIVDRRQQFHVEWSVALPLLILLGIIMITAKATGFGFRLFGNEVYGGRKYFTLGLAIAGFFALSCRSVPRAAALWLVGAFFLFETLAALSNLVFLAGPQFYWLYYLVPAKYSMHMIAAEGYLGADTIVRFGGIGTAAKAVCLFLLCRFGVRRLFAGRHPLALILFVVMFAVSFLGGFRSTLLFFAVLLCVQFVLEKAYRTVALPIVLGVAVLGLAVVAPFASHLPLPVQRVLTLLPVEVSSTVRKDADSSLQWRLDMWRVLLPMVPQYFWLGKGLTLDPTDYHMAAEAQRRGFIKSFEVSLVAGDYHNGVFTVLITFGIFGLAAFLWFVTAAIRILYRHHKHGDPQLQSVNTFFLALFVSQLLFYFFFYGQFYADLYYYTGLVGLSLALNRSWLLRSPAAVADGPAPASAPPTQAAADAGTGAGTGQGDHGGGLRSDPGFA